MLVGKDPGELNRLKPKALIEAPQPASMEPWVEAAERDSFVVQAQQAAAEAANKQIEINRAGHYPTLDVVANYGANNGPGQLGVDEIDTTTRQVGLQHNITIFQGGAVNSRVREAIATWRTGEQAALDNATRNAALGARQAYLGVVNGLAGVRALEAALVSSLSSLESNRLGYEVGVRINIDVLNAENQVYVTRRTRPVFSLYAIGGQLCPPASDGQTSFVSFE